LFPEGVLITEVDAVLTVFIEQILDVDYTESLIG